MSFNFSKLHDLFDNVLNQWQVPNAVIGMIDEAGLSDVYIHGDGVDHKTLFPAASLTKAMTGLSMGILADHHNTSVLAPVIDTLPDLELFDPYVAQHIQWIDLICHRAGLPLQGMTLFANWGFDREGIKSALKTVKPMTSFRSHYAYNNALYVYVESLIEALSGKAYHEFMQEHIFNPLDMTQSFIGKAGLQSGLPFVQGYALFDENRLSLDESEPQGIDFAFHPETYRCAGGVVSCLMDLAKWVYYQLFEHRELARPSTFQLLRRPFTVVDPFTFYGAGWRISDARPKRVISHGGNIPGIQHQLFFIPEDKVGFVILTNLSQSDAATVIMQYMLDAWMDRNPLNYQDDLYKLYEGDWNVRMRRLNSETDKHFDMKQGTYTCEALGSIRLLKEGPKDLLVIEKTGAKAHIRWIDAATANLHFGQECGGALGSSNWGQIHFKNHKPVLLSGSETFKGEKYAII